MTHRITELAELKEEEEVTICGLVTATRQIPTKKDPSKFLRFVTVEDLTGKVDCVCFHKKLLEYGELLELDNKVVVTGRIQHRGEEQISLLIDSVKSVENANIVTVSLKSCLLYTSNSRLGSGDDQKLIQHKFDIQKYLDDSYNANKKVKPDKLDKLFTTETGWGKHTYEYTRAEKVANTIIPSVGKDPNKLTNAQVQAFAEKLDNGAATPAGYRSRTVFEVVEGKRKPVKYAFSSDMFNEFRNSENAKVAEQRTELIESLLNRAKENIGLQKRQANFVKDFIETVPDSTAEKTGLFNTTKGGRKEVKITNIISEATSKPSFYDKDLNKVAKAIEKNGGAYTTCLLYTSRCV